MELHALIHRCMQTDALKYYPSNYEPKLSVQFGSSPLANRQLKLYFLGEDPHTPSLQKDGQ